MESTLNKFKFSKFSCKLRKYDSEKESWENRIKHNLI